jgi:hypothetical protein
MPDPRTPEEELAGAAEAVPGAEAPLGPPPPEEAAPVGAEEPAPPAGSEISVDADTFPEVAALAVGDPITLVVTEVSDDGKTIKLGPSAEGLPAVEPGAGQAAIAAQVLGQGPR